MPDRVANLTVSHRGRPPCHYCDQCQRGCHTASYFNSPSVTLPAAARTGRFTLVSDAVVSHVRIDSRGRCYQFLRREAIRGYVTSQAGLKELDYKGNAFYGACPGCQSRQG